MLRAFVMWSVVVIALCLAKPIIPGETLLQLAEEVADYPPAMEGDQAPAPSHKSSDMNAPPKFQPAQVEDESVVSLLELDESNDFGPALKQLMTVFGEATKPLSQDEVKAVSDIVKVGSDFLFAPQKKANVDIGQNLLQTDAPSTDDKTVDMISTFAKIIDYPISETEKAQLSHLIAGFSALIGSDNPSKGMEEHLGLTNLLDLPDEHPMNIMNDMTHMFNEAMEAHFAGEEGEDEEESVSKHMAIMPESAGDSEDYDMDAMSTQKPAASQPEQNFEAQFNMNVNQNKMMDENARNADTMMMNGPAMMMRRSVVVEEPVQKGPDAMQEASLNAQAEPTLDLMDEQQLVEEKDEVTSVAGNALQPMGGGVPTMGRMPEAEHNSGLVNEMEKNVKITQIPDHTG